MPRLAICIGAGLLFAVSVWAQSASNTRAQLDNIEQTLRAEVPRVLCLDGNFATGAQPAATAYSKAAANGFRSVLSLRTASEGFDHARERALVEAAKLRYHNISVESAHPRREQANEFLRLLKNADNHPMLITCASANRVGAFMMIFRVTEQGWSEAQALAEANRIGLRSDNLREFARQYIAERQNSRP